MKNIKAGKRQIILAALVLALGSAVYLNWRFSSPNDFIAETSTTSTKELGQAQFVNNTVENAQVETNEEKNENTENNEGDGTVEKNSAYFEKTKFERQKAREEAIKNIKDIIEDEKSSEETKKEAVKQAALIAQKIEEEANIVALVKAKGFEQCLAFIQNDECTIVVGGQPLTELLATQIKDIACSQGKIAVDKIKILEAQ